MDGFSKNFWNAFGVIGVGIFALIILTLIVVIVAELWPWSAIPVFVLFGIPAIYAWWRTR